MSAYHMACVFMCNEPATQRNYLTHPWDPVCVQSRQTLSSIAERGWIPKHTCAHLTACIVDDKGRVLDEGLIKVLVPAVDAVRVLKIHLRSSIHVTVSPFGL